jgi:hypothetical protein
MTNMCFSPITAMLSGRLKQWQYAATHGSVSYCNGHNSRKDCMAVRRACTCDANRVASNAPFNSIVAGGTQTQPILATYIIFMSLRARKRDVMADSSY